MEGGSPRWGWSSYCTIGWRNGSVLYPRLRLIHPFKTHTRIHTFPRTWRPFVFGNCFVWVLSMTCCHRIVFLKLYQDSLRSWNCGVTARHLEFARSSLWFCPCQSKTSSVTTIMVTALLYWTYGSSCWLPRFSNINSIKLASTMGIANGGRCLGDIAWWCNRTWQICVFRHNRWSISTENGSRCVPR